MNSPKRIPWNKGLKGFRAGPRGPRPHFIPWNKGKTGVYSEETLSKIREARKLQKNPSGPAHWHWKGGYSVGLNRIQYIVATGRKRKAQKRGSSGTHSLADWIHLKERHDFICLSCGRREPEITLTEDHIVPLSRGGSHSIDNIQPLCRACNARKSTKAFAIIGPFSPIYG